MSALTKEEQAWLDDLLPAGGHARQIIDRLAARVEKFETGLAAMSNIDCRFSAAGLGNVSAKHCPFDAPCQRCELESEVKSMKLKE